MDKRVSRIYDKLFSRYGHQNWWPIVEKGHCSYLDEYRKRERTDSEIFEIMIGSILTQNTSWENAAKALSKIKEESFMDPAVLSSLEIPRLAGIIKGSGYYNQKARKIAALSRFLNGSSRGIQGFREFSLDDARKMLLSVWGIGKETADSILLYGFYFLIFVIDAYTLRLFSRIGIESAGKGYDALQKHIMDNIPADRVLYQDFHALIVLLGKNVCRKEPSCDVCILSGMCLFAEKKTGYAQKSTKLRTAGDMS